MHPSSKNNQTLPSAYSNRKFGWFLVAICSGFAITTAFQRSIRMAEIWLAFCAAFALVTLLRPSLLTWLNNLWFHLGDLMGKVTNPVVLGILFFGVITPLAMVLRLLGRDALAIRQKKPISYWVDRDQEPSNRPESFKHPF